MRIHLIQGNDRQAVMLSEELERKFTNPDGTMTKPMRVADALTVRATVATRQGDIDMATRQGDIDMASSLRMRPSTSNARPFRRSSSTRRSWPPS